MAAYLTTREAAARLGVSASTLRRLVERGLLVPIRLTETSRFKFRSSDCDELIARSQARERAGV